MGLFYITKGVNKTNNKLTVTSLIHKSTCINDFFILTLAFK